MKRRKLSWYYMRVFVQHNGRKVVYPTWKTCAGSGRGGLVLQLPKGEGIQGTDPRVVSRYEGIWQNFWTKRRSNSLLLPHPRGKEGLNPPCMVLAPLCLRLRAGFLLRSPGLSPRRAHDDFFIVRSCYPCVNNVQTTKLPGTLYVETSIISGRSKWVCLAKCGRREHPPDTPGVRRDKVPERTG